MSLGSTATRIVAGVAGAVMATTLLAAPAQAVNAPAAAPAYSSNDNAFYKAVTRMEPSMKYLGSKRGMIKVAKLTCKAFRAGNSFEEVAGVLIESDLNGDQIATLIAGAISFYCPDQEYVLE